MSKLKDTLMRCKLQENIYSVESHDLLIVITKPVPNDVFRKNVTLSLHNGKYERCNTYTYMYVRGYIFDSYLMIIRSN